MEPPQVLLETSRFRVVRRARTLPDGRVHRREVVEHPGAVVVLPREADGRVWLIRSFRLAVGETLWELPAGTLEPGEDPGRAASRELAEETGLRAGQIRLLHRFWMSPGILSERMHLYCAEQLTPGPTALELGEEIEAHPVQWDEALAMVGRGEIQDAKTLVGLLWFDRFGHQAGG